YVPLLDVEPEVADVVLTALRRARIAAYLQPDRDRPTGPARLYVAEGERADARSIVGAATRHVRPDGNAAVASEQSPGVAETPDGIDETPPDHPNDSVTDQAF